MLESPFDIIGCSWPEPVEQSEGDWVSEPEWDAPAMPYCPSPRLELLDDEWCWLINWREFFRQGCKWYEPHMGGEMRGFHIIFRLRIKETGTLIFWDDDGSLIRRNGELLHVDRSAHRLHRHELFVSAGDVLDVAQWQFGWDWLWAARLQGTSACSPLDLLRESLTHVEAKLHRPNGPPLKLYTHGHTPLRVVVALYSLIVNGYVPERVYLSGQDQWRTRTRNLLQEFLPFADIVTSEQVIRFLSSLGGTRLAELARRHWFVMKTCIGLLYPPQQCAVMDDDVFVLDSLDDALAAFEHNDLVFVPDQDLGAAYRSAWPNLKGGHPLPTARFNAGLYWVRPVHDARWLAGQALRGNINPSAPYLWEQGFIAMMYAHQRTVQLPNQRYLFPLFDGLPGGMIGYDYEHNPCRFASVHFGGLAEKPSDGTSLQIAAQILPLSQPLIEPGHSEKG